MTSKTSHPNKLESYPSANQKSGELDLGAEESRRGAQTARAFCGIVLLWVEGFKNFVSYSLQRGTHSCATVKT